MAECHRIQMLHVPDCPLVGRLRADVEWCLEDVAPWFAVELVEGDHSSPTLLVDGIDVTNGAPVVGQPRCRPDLPSSEQIRAAHSALL